MIETISRSRLVDLLAAGSGKRVAIIGDAMLDVYLHGDVDRISPEAPVPVVRITERRTAPGGAANVAANVAAIGADPSLVCAIGADRNGERLRKMLDEMNTRNARSRATDHDEDEDSRQVAAGRAFR